MTTKTEPRITQPGRTLANKLASSIGVSGHIVRTCSLLARHARTHHRLAEEECNGPPDRFSGWTEGAKRTEVICERRNDKWQEAWAACLEKRIARCEGHIRYLVLQLPLVNGQPIEPVFSGDPRGATVKLRMPDGRYDDWGQVGICVLE